MNQLLPQKNGRQCKMKVNNTEPSWSSCQAKVEATKNRKKTTAELLLDFDEEIDRLFLEDSMIKPQDRNDSPS